MAGYLPFQDQNLMSMYRKIYKGEFRCARLFSPGLVKLLARILDINPVTRITIPEIISNRWFIKGFKDIKFYIEDDKLYRFTDDVFESESDSELEVRKPVPGLPRPASLNALDIISFSKDFNLSGLFEEGGEEGSRFVSGAPVSEIISKLEEIATVVSFTVRKKDCKVNLEGSKEEAKGPLTLQAEIFELTPSLVVVEVKKKGGIEVSMGSFVTGNLSRTRLHEPNGLIHIRTETRLR